MLHLTDEAALAFRQANRELGRPVLSLVTEDCAGEAERLKARGVVFVREPGRMAYGRHGCGVRRPLRQPSPGLTEP